MKLSPSTTGHRGRRTSSNGTPGKLSSASDPRVCIQVRIGALKLNALVDTGACRSMIRTDVWKDICAQARRQPLLRPGLRLRSLSGHEIPTRGRGETTLFGHKVNFYVTDTLHHEALFGTDIIATLDAEIRYKEEVVLLNGQRHQYRQWSGEDRHVASVHTDLDRWMKEFPRVFASDGQPNGCTDAVTLLMQSPYQLTREVIHPSDNDHTVFLSQRDA